MMNYPRLIAYCSMAFIALQSSSVAAGATIPPPSPPPLCTDLTPPPVPPVPTATYRYHSDAPPSTVGLCSGRAAEFAVNPLPDGSFEYLVSRPITDLVYAYVMCRSSGQIVTCEANPTSKNVKLDYGWQVSGALNRTMLNQARGTTISVSCLPGEGTGTITLTVVSPFTVGADSTEIPVTCSSSGSTN